MPAYRRIRMRVLALGCLLFATLLAACGGGASPTPAPFPLPMAELKYRVMDAGGRISFCDPDFYPIARADESAQIDQMVPVAVVPCQARCFECQHRTQLDAKREQNFQRVEADSKAGPLLELASTVDLRDRSDRTGAGRNRHFVADLDVARHTRFHPILDSCALARERRFSLKADD